MLWFGQQIYTMLYSLFDQKKSFVLCKINCVWKTLNDRLFRTLVMICQKIDLIMLNVKLTLRADPLHPPPLFLNINPMFSFQIHYRMTPDLTTVFSYGLLKLSFEQSVTAHDRNYVSIQFMLNTKILSLLTICWCTHPLYPQSSAIFHRKCN